jgi:phage terminase large subunit-like protein
MGRNTTEEDTSRDYVGIANKYARDVVAGKIPNCRWVIAACKRHLDDLARVREPDYPYRFDADKAAAVCEFGESLPHTKGKWARDRELIHLQPWQCFVLCCIFGWVKKKNGLRRFNETYLEIPRKNGKSVLAAIVGLWCFCMDDEHGAEVYSGATTEKQAWEVFRPALAMFESQEAEELRELVGGEAWAKSMNTSDGSRFEPMIGKPGDGASPSCAIADEYHEHDTSDQVDTMQTGMGAREQPLMLIITTAGVNLAGPCFDKRDDAIKVLDGVTENDYLFTVIYSIDLPVDDEGGDDWADPKILSKANPNLGVSVDADWLIAQQRSAVINPANQNRFKTKHLNIWCSAKTAWMSSQLWQACGDPELLRDELREYECVLSLDLASKSDLACLGETYFRMMDGLLHMYYFARYYLPEAAVELEDGNPNRNAYEKWATKGLLTVTGGAELDFSVIREDVKAILSSGVQVREIAYDSWRATQLAQELANEGATMVEVRQNTQQMSLPMKEIMSACKNRRYHHDQNPITAWCFTNVVAIEDAKGNVFPNKQKNKPHLKIDGAVCAIMGVARVMAVTGVGSINDWLRAPVAVTRS